MPELVQKNRQNKGFFCSYILQRIEQNKNFMAVITGPTGSGKSFSAMHFGEKLDPDFNIDKVVFSPKELMVLVNSNKLKRGDVIVYDEAGVTLGHRDWYSVTNKMINYFVQTSRHKGFIMFFTAPSFSFVDISTRKLFHCLMETRGINFAKKKVNLKPLLLQENQRTGQIYLKYLRVVTSEGVLPLKMYKSPMPSKQLVRDYEKKKLVFTSNLNRDIEIEINVFGSQYGRELTTYQDDVLSLLKEGKTVKDIATIKECSIDNIHKNVNRIRKKGIQITFERDKNNQISAKILDKRVFTQKNLS